MDAFVRGFPLVATFALGAAHAFAWRTSSPIAAWLILGAAYLVVAAMAAFILRREEALGEAFEVVSGDVSRGIGGAALIVFAGYAVGILAIKVAPAFTSRELSTLVQVRAAVAPEWKRAAAIVAFAVAEELVFRAAATHVLEERFGSKRAPWLASALYVVAAIPSLHPGVIAAAIGVGAVTAFVVAQWRRPFIAMVAHAAFTWVALELVLPILWAKRVVP